MFARLALLAAALAASTPALAGPLLKRDHVLTFTNNCPQQITPMIHAVDGSFLALAPLGQGGVATTTVPENWNAGRAFGQTGQCSQPDGAGCTLVECDFSTTDFRQCNLSRVSGFNVPMGFQFDAADCGGNFCDSATCDGNAAFGDATDGGPSLRQCNDANVGMHITFC